MPQQQQGRGPTLREEAQHRIAKYGADKPGDRYGAHRAAEVSFWNDWTRSGASPGDRNDSYAHAAIMVAELYHTPELYEQSPQAA